MTHGSAPAAAAFAAAQRIVVKVGSATLTGDGESVREDWLRGLAADIAATRSRGADVVVVSSGAIALGRRRLGLKGALRLDEKQAASAAGQAALVEAWRRAFAPVGIEVAQILLTVEDVDDRRRYLNARATFSTLLELAALPVVNENDTVATSEIRYGDNDRLAAHVAQLIGADALVILSDIDGVYDADPRRAPHATRLDVIDAITPEIEAAAAGPNAAAGLGSGGMATKIAAARIAGAAGAVTIIAPGIARPLDAIAAGGAATLIRAAQTPENARRLWIGARLKPVGEIAIDAGAAAALEAGASLLPAGVTAVAGEFRRGDPVAVRGPDGRVLGQGLSAYHANEIAQIAGRRSDEIAAILGYRRRPAVIEKNDLVLKG